MSGSKMPVWKTPETMVTRARGVTPRLSVLDFARNLAFCFPDHFLCFFIFP